MFNEVNRVVMKYYDWELGCYKFFRIENNEGKSISIISEVRELLQSYGVNFCIDLEDVYNLDNNCKAHCGTTVSFAWEYKGKVYLKTVFVPLGV